MTEIGTVQSAPESVRILLSRGGKVNTKDKAGQTALILAAKTDSWDAVHREAALQSARLLINKGADKNAKTRNGNTALKWAQMRHHFEIVRLLQR
jgi:ankyrin repeat protein